MPTLKPIEEVVACVVDFGTFISISEKLGETCAKVYYHSPYEVEYQRVRDCIKGTGLDRVERLDDLLDPDILPTIDLFVFPDIGYGGLQRYLRSIGKAVWGHMGATDLELQRDFFLKVLKDVGLPTIHSERIVGLTALVEYLQENEHKWIKINRFRGNMETWKHVNYAQSEDWMTSLAVIFGGAKDHVIFTVQDHLESQLEIGYDGWCIDGQFPPSSYQGYEKKNELYLGSMLEYDDLPMEIRFVNERMAPVLADYGYRGWWATEIRVVDGVPYFIDPTPRMPGQTGEHQLESCLNFAEVVWAGANGIVVQPKWLWKVAAEATLHFKAPTKDPAIGQEWKRLAFPDDPELLRWFKFYYYCKMDGLYHFVAENTDEIGIVIGVGNAAERAIDHLKENLEAVKDLPISAETKDFTDLLESVQEAEKQGVKFGGKIPKPESVL